MRRINSHFHIDDEQIIKTSNGQPIPPEEPVFIFRGRDKLAVEALLHYVHVAKDDGCNEEFLASLGATIDEFRQFRIQYHDRMKQPGITRGK